MEDEDTDTGTDTTAPDDDNDDIAAFTSHPYPKPVTFPHAPLRGPSPTRMEQHALELEDLFDDNRISFHTVTNSLTLERQVYTQRAFLQASPAAPQLSRRPRGARLLCALMVTAALPHHTCVFTLQVVDLTQEWSNAAAERITHMDFLPWSQLSTYTPSCASPLDKGISTVYLTYSKPLQRSSYEEAHAPRQPTLSSVHCSAWSTKWQSSRPQSGSTFASCGAPHDNNVDLEKRTLHTPDARRYRHSSPHWPYVDSVPVLDCQVVMAAWFVSVLVHSWLSNRDEQ